MGAGSTADATSASEAEASAMGAGSTAGATAEVCFLAARRLAKSACLREARAARFCSAELAA